MTVVAVRHLPTAWSLEKRLQGRADLPILSGDERPAGYGEIIRAGRAHLAAMPPFDGVFCSTLRRTRETAAAFGRADAVPLPALNELDFGPFEGRLVEEFKARYGDRWLTAPHTIVLGEPVAALADRIRSFLSGDCAGMKRVLVFGHGAWLRALVSLARTGSIESMNRQTVEFGRMLEIAWPETAGASREEDGASRPA